MWRSTSVVLAGLMVLAGCSDDDDVASPPASTPVTASPSADTKVLNELVEIAPGRKLYIYCTGPTSADAGEGTILLEAGGGSGSEDWPPQLITTLAERSRVCAYDRAGTGSSGPAPDEKRTMADVVSDLDLLLDAVHMDGRLLLVGTSFGGEAVLNWALRHPDRTAGMVILDTDWPTTDESKSVMQYVSDEQRAEYLALDKWDAPGNNEHIDYQNTAPEAEAAFRTLPGIPIRILSATQTECDVPGDACTRLREGAVELQKQWLKLSPTARQRIVDAPHNLPEDATDIVLEEILAALDEADFEAAGASPSESASP